MAACVATVVFACLRAVTLRKDTEQRSPLCSPPLPLLLAAVITTSFVVRPYSIVATRAYRSFSRSVFIPSVLPACHPSYRKGKRKLMDTDFCEELAGTPFTPSGPCAMRKLPSELLNEIFLWTLPPVPSFRAAESPLILTHVCSWWRECAVSHSALWDTIYLPSPVEGLSLGIVELCKVWLERSKARPLSVDFHLASDYQPWKISVEHILAIEEVVRLLAPHAHRITKLLRVFPRFLLDDLRLEDMHMLDDLFICDVSDNIAGQTRIAPHTLYLPETLRCLSLRQTFFDVKAFTSLRNIQHLDIWQLQGEGQMSVGTCLKLLRELNWLESCTLDVAQNDYNREIVMPEISMPNLSFLFISWDWLVDVSPILDTLHAPNLRRLGLRGPPPTRRQWGHLRHFLKRGRPALTQLSIKEIGFTDIQLVDCLRLIPTLTNLSLSHCSVDSNFIKALRLDPRIPVMHNVLPMLEFLSLEACDDFEVKDLISMLNTRGKGRQVRARRLRGIRLSFCRRILEAHRKDIENSGVENVIVRVNRSSRNPPR